MTSKKTSIQFAYLGTGKSFVSFASLLRQIMTLIVIQFVRLVAPFTSLEKVVNYNRKVIC